MTIRQATQADCEILTEISFSSKNYWTYPKEYFDIWKNELTITAEYISNNHVFVSVEDGKTIGYYSVVVLEKDLSLKEFTIERGVWLEHAFIRPEHIGQGYGRRLMQHLIKQAQNQKWAKLKILADPHSKEFYEKLGAKYIKEVPSNIAGRTVSYFEWTTENS